MVFLHEGMLPVCKSPPCPLEVDPKWFFFFFDIKVHSGQSGPKWVVWAQVRLVPIWPTFLGSKKGGWLWPTKQAKQPALQATWQPLRTAWSRRRNHHPWKPIKLNSTFIWNTHAFFQSKYESWDVDMHACCKGRNGVWPTLKNRLYTCWQTNWLWGSKPHILGVTRSKIGY